MNNKKLYYSIGILLCGIAIGFFVFVGTHPEYIFSYPKWVNYTLFALYAGYIAFMFYMPRWKGANIGSCIILAVEFIALGCIVLSMGSMKVNGSTNWYLPVGLFLTCIGNFANLYMQRKNK